MQSKIIISNDFDTTKSRLKQECKNIRFYEYDSLSIDNAKEIITQAYIAEYEPKNIVIIAKKFENAAQNALLKVLEEPPNNIFFTIIAPSKNVLLATIISRLMLENHFVAKQRVKYKLDLFKLDLRLINAFVRNYLELKAYGKFTALELSELVSSIICDAIDNGTRFNSKELEYLRKLSAIAALNAPLEAVLTPLLLLIMEKTKR